MLCTAAGAPPGHVEQGDAVVVRLGLGHDAILVLVDVAARMLYARVLVRPAKSGALSTNLMQFLSPAC